MAQQTAIEWLAEQINGKSINYPFSTYADITISIPIELFEQAKQMEKEQIIQARHDGIVSAIKGRSVSNDDYYNETYGQ
jgi:hypothetical protein